MEDPEVKALLVEIRDAQRELLAEYRRLAGESVETQRRSFEIQSRAVEQQAVAVKNQLQGAKLYRVVLVVAGILAVFLLYWLSKLT